MSRIREYIRSKSSRSHGAVPEPVHVLEVGEEPQVLTQNFTVERTVEVFTVHWDHCRCESVEVKESGPRQTRERTILRVVLYVRKRVRCRCQGAVVKARLVNEVPTRPAKLPAGPGPKNGGVIAFEETSRSRL